MTDKWIATPSRTTEIMQKYDIKMKKSLGQNFLIESNILAKMIETGQINQQTTVIEIGPGIGALTEYLAHYAKRVVAFEIDSRFIEILADTLEAYDNVEIVHQDILSVDFNSPEFSDLQNAEELVVCANLPYYITTPIIIHLLSSSLNFKRLVMMMQKEVAERMTATVGTKAYNSLTIAIQNQMVSKLAFVVPKSVFVPKPNVDSAVLLLEKREEPLVCVDDSQGFEQFVRLGFVQRRKTLWNNYRTALISEKYSLDALEKLFTQSQIEANRRAETLSIYEFAELFKVYQSQIAE